MVDEKTDEDTVKINELNETNDEVKRSANDSHDSSVHNDDTYKDGDHSFFDTHNVLEMTAQDSYEEFSDDVDDEFNNYSEASADEDIKAAMNEALDEPAGQGLEEGDEREVKSEDLNGLEDEKISESGQDEATQKEKDYMDHSKIEAALNSEHGEDITFHQKEEEKVSNDDVSATQNDIHKATEEQEEVNEGESDKRGTNLSFEDQKYDESQMKDEQSIIGKPDELDKRSTFSASSSASSSSSKSGKDAFSYDWQSATPQSKEANADSASHEKNSQEHPEEYSSIASNGSQKSHIEETKAELNRDIVLENKMDEGKENTEDAETDTKMKDLSVAPKEATTSTLNSLESGDATLQATSSTLFVNSTQRIEPSERDVENQNSLSFPANTDVNISSPQPAKDTSNDYTEDELPNFVLDPASDMANLNDGFSRLELDNTSRSSNSTYEESQYNGGSLEPSTQISRGRHDSFYARATSPVSSAISWFSSKRSDLSPDVSSTTSFYLEEVLAKNPSLIDDNRKKEIMNFLETERHMIPSEEIYNLLFEFIENPLKVLREKSEEIHDLIFSHEVQGVHTVLWKSISAWSSFENERQYSDLVRKSCESDKAIRKDLDRTFPPEILERFFSNRDQKSPDIVSDSIANLHKVLRSLANAIPEVGYTQGMSWIAGSLLMYLPPPQAFSMLVFLFKEYNLQSIFSPELKGLSRIMYQFTQLVEDFMPALAIHLKKNEIDTCSYASEWFLTLFAYKFPLNIVAKIYDILLFYGPTILLNIGLGLLNNSEKILLKLNNDELITYLKDNIFSSFMLGDEPDQYDMTKILQCAFAFEISKSSIDKYGHEFDISLLTEREVDTQLETTKNTNKSLNDHFSVLSESMSKLQIEHESMSSMLVQEKLVLKRQAEEQAGMESKVASLHGQLSKIRSEVESSFQGEMEAIIAENLKIMSEGQVLEDELFRKEKLLAETKVNLATMDGEYMLAIQKWSQLMNRIKNG
ncbi:GTPase activating protein Gyp51 [Schizosaccharomyces cryophilus OY26]|uniref:GTPase activating protein Gyp51 n=1 Tax=Schizosaccharomyces cryophilus (strain OY26 / ATCC MYA-4695 / CBS 11777 / NBRC 106824 / NRRL Y48691) TaxID=653667 RepID=S9WZR6_SCHCR|nr:GTPase activating protein Gyp51 [Schizosaccharomyces cryophilus OY26]EPY50217.1 GTPase activating protein Gyp51 [Schizosaccharomyces cryophilus OY26]